MEKGRAGNEDLPVLEVDYCAGGRERRERREGAEKILERAEGAEGTSDSGASESVRAWADY